ncbi:TetR/AcrR family transcriptional regulator [Streptomyces sp. M19]
MVDVAAAAGVSRQTLYNEFGSKEGLARALVRREADAYLSGVEEALVTGARGPGPVNGWPPPPSGPYAPRATTPRTGRAHRLLERAAARACPPRPDGGADGRVPRRAALAGRTARPGTGPGRAAAGGPVAAGGASELSRACEVATRLALSYVVAPGASEDVASLVRRAVRRRRTHPRATGPRANAVALFMILVRCALAAQGEPYRVSPSRRMSPVSLYGPVSARHWNQDHQ